MSAGNETEGGAPKLSWREYAVFARQTADELYRDCELEVFRASGPGGQGVNTTDSAVRLRHVPTGIAVVSRESRSQLQNRQNCLEKLHEILAKRAKPPRPRKKTRPTKASKERRLKTKHMRSDLKSLRSRKDFE